jgi:hypothetical protein
MVRRFALAASAAALLIAGGAFAGARADGLKPIEGKSFSLGTVSGIVYYTPGPTGYRVVATMLDGADGTVVRFVATLAPEQSVTLSTPREAGESAVEVRLVRHGDDLFLDDGGRTAREATATAMAMGLAAAP